jgi:gentisate 1,2-dioxygenase
MEGGGAYTAVDGERVYMEPGDLILTPSWSWHDHGNETDRPILWMDGLDIPLIASLDAMFFQFYTKEQVPATRAANNSKHLHGHAHLGPTWVKEKSQASPLLLYSWDQTRKALDALRDQEGSPFDGIALEYHHPQTGGPVMPTMGCWIQMLRPGERTKKHRHTSSHMYFVVRGEGTTMVGEQALEWKQHDSFVVPNWAWHEHVNRSNSDDAILFSVNDIPVMKAFDLYREEPENSLGAVAAPPVPPVRA